MFVSLPISLPLAQPTLFQAVLESLVDGIAIFSDRGELIHANKKARTLCEQLPPNPNHPQGIPQAILQVCHALIEGQQLWSDRVLAIESEVQTQPSNSLRLCGRWVKWEQDEPAYLSITLEDRYQSSLEQQGLEDGEKYGLTPRETEVWSLRCARYTYKEIAAKLYISENTVKKHLKNVRVKQRATHGLENQQ